MKNVIQKSIFALFIAILTISCATKNVDNEELELINKLSKKYDLQVNINKKEDFGGVKSKEYSAEQLDSLFKKLKVIHNENEQHRKEAEKLNKEIAEAGHAPKVFYDLVEKYPTVRRQVVRDAGGEEAFQKEKKNALEMIEKSKKIRRE